MRSRKKNSLYLLPRLVGTCTISYQEKREGNEKNRVKTNILVSILVPYSQPLSCPGGADLLQLMWKLMWSRKSSFFSCKTSTNLLGLMHISASYLISFETTVYSTLAAKDHLKLKITKSGWSMRIASAYLIGAPTKF